ncbi:MAG: SlyX family protein [Polaromonas sp.]|nr:SlyX family protein [Polaromonas sp.]
MTHSDPTDQRLTELEIKATFSEDLLDQLNLVIVRQQAQIDLLIKEIQQLREQQPDGVAGGAARLMDDLPPHY